MWCLNVIFKCKAAHPMHLYTYVALCTLLEEIKCCTVFKALTYLMGLDLKAKKVVG